MSISTRASMWTMFSLSQIIHFWLMPYSIVAVSTDESEIGPSIACFLTTIFEHLWNKPLRKRKKWFYFPNSGLGCCHIYILETVKWMRQWWSFHARDTFKYQVHVITVGCHFPPNSLITVRTASHKQILLLFFRGLQRILRLYASCL